MSCKTCDHYRKPPRLGFDVVVGEKGKCLITRCGEWYRTVEPNESCCMDTSYQKESEVER
jgi:hypothetical protein